MATDVVMPQMGESIAEGTIVRWIKKVGDPIDKDEPLFEISTDKVDAEIPSPGAGVVLEITVKEGETVPVNSVVARIGAKGEQPAAGASTAAASMPAAAPAAAPGETGPDGAGVTAAPVAVKAASAPASPAGAEATLADLRRTRSSPLVRKIAKEHGIDITGLNGTGISGRVTKKDITGFIESGGAAARAASPASARAASIAPPPAFQPGENVRIEKMGVMRRKIADHMVMSIHTS
ncbi:MAG TPA: biotin/lipoyl-containing protein, partial [Vicinamibacterales bacterium]|nr:biotin/lipoyl-containing protein [Vicinamibacterales bacterium]